MKSKLLGFALALLSVGTIGVLAGTMTPADAVANCTVKTVGTTNTYNKPHSKFTIQNRVGKVKYTATGDAGCKADVALKVYYTLNEGGLPREAQQQYKVATAKVGKGTHTLSVQMPPAACYFQLDFVKVAQNPANNKMLGYVLGGNKSCIAPQPSAACDSLTVAKLANNQYKLTAKASAKDGAKIKGYTFTVSKGGNVIKTQNVPSTKKSESYTYSQAAEGTYTVKATVKTSVGDKNGANCTKTFTIPPTNTPQPGISINKLVEGVDYMKVGTDVEYDYQIAVTNTGDVDLTNAVITDTPEAGVSLLSASEGTVANNTWTHTIPSLAVGETMDFTITAKVPEFLAGRIKNTVCVDAPEVPGNPDDCDDADVEVEEPGKVVVCDPETGETISVDEADADQYPQVGSPECESAVVCNPETGELINVPASEQSDYDTKDSEACKDSEAPVESVEELPETGPADALLSLIGAGSLVGSGAYYTASRRKL